MPAASPTCSTNFVFANGVALEAGQPALAAAALVVPVALAEAGAEAWTEYDATGPGATFASPILGEATEITGPLAARLFISSSTVKTHVKSVLEKLGAPDRAAAVAEAMRRGLID